MFIARWWWWWFVLCQAIVIVVTVAFVQEYKSEQALEQLEQLVSWDELKRVEARKEGWGQRAWVD